MKKIIMNNFQVTRYYPQSQETTIPMLWSKTHDIFVIECDYYKKEEDFFNFYNSKEKDEDYLVASFPADKNTIIVKN